MTRACVLLALASVAPLLSDEAGKTYVQVTLERMVGTDWRAVDPRMVMQPGDKVRFRFSTTFPGYLYVFNRGSDGKTDKIEGKVQNLVGGLKDARS